jgi:hypothetical protein
MKNILKSAISGIGHHVTVQAIVPALLRGPCVVVKRNVPLNARIDDGGAKS